MELIIPIESINDRGVECLQEQGFVMVSNGYMDESGEWFYIFAKR